jgi:hypothetical protein
VVVVEHARVQAAAGQAAQHSTGCALGVVAAAQAASKDTGTHHEPAVTPRQQLAASRELLAALTRG